MVSDDREENNKSPSILNQSNESILYPQLLVANDFLYKKEEDQGNIYRGLRVIEYVEETVNKPYIVNIQSRKQPESEQRSVQALEYELEQDLHQDVTQDDEEEELEPMPEPEQRSQTESRQSRKSQSNKSIEMFDSKKFAPVLK